MKENQIDQLHSKGCLNVLGKNVPLSSDDKFVTNIAPILIQKERKHWQDKITFPLIDDKAVPCYSILKSQVIPTNQTVMLKARIPELENQTRIATTALIEPKSNNPRNTNLQFEPSVLVDVDEGGHC